MNGWAKRQDDYIHCLYPRCSKKYLSKGSTSSTVSTHLQRGHKITKKDINNGMVKHTLGPLDAHLSQHGTGCTRDDFLESLVNYFVENKLAFSLCGSSSFQHLVDTIQHTPLSVSLKLPSNDTLLCKVKTCFFHYYFDDKYIYIFTVDTTALR
jgi:hypothetical protein